MSFMDLSSVVKSLPQSTLILLRPSETAIVAGFRQSAGGETLGQNFSAHVQPTKPREIAKIEGGESIESAISIWTSTELRTADDRLGREADLVEYSSRRYKIVSAGDWSAQGYRKFIGGEVAIA